MFFGAPSSRLRRGVRSRRRALRGVDLGPAVNLDPHVRRGTGDDLHRTFHLDAVQIGHLNLGDFLELLLGHAPDDLLLRIARPLGHARGFLQQHRRRRGLQNEREGLILENGNLNRV